MDMTFTACMNLEETEKRMDAQSLDFYTSCIPGISVQEIPDTNLNDSTEKSDLNAVGIMNDISSTYSSPKESYDDVIHDIETFLCSQIQDVATSRPLNMPLICDTNYENEILVNSKMQICTGYGNENQVLCVTENDDSYIYDGRIEEFKHTDGKAMDCHSSCDSQTQANSDANKIQKRDANYVSEVKDFCTNAVDSEKCIRNIINCNVQTVCCADDVNENSFLSEDSQNEEIWRDFFVECNDVRFAEESSVENTTNRIFSKILETEAGAQSASAGLAEFLKRFSQEIADENENENINDDHDRFEIVNRGTENLMQFMDPQECDVFNSILIQQLLMDGTAWCNDDSCNSENMNEKNHNRNTNKEEFPCKSGNFTIRLTRLEKMKFPYHHFLSNGKTLNNDNTFTNHAIENIKNQVVEYTIKENNNDSDQGSTERYCKSTDTKHEDKKNVKVNAYYAKQQPAYFAVCKSTADARDCQNDTKNFSAKKKDLKKIFLCVLCKENFFERYTFIEHLEEHVLKSYRYCSHTCKYRTVDKYAFKKHLISHNETFSDPNKPFCMKTNNAKKHLRIRKSHKNWSKSKFPCAFCSSVLTTRSKLLKHLTKHF